MNFEGEGTSTFTPAVPAGVVLSPASSPEFSAPETGVLQYNGAEARVFSITSLYTLFWNTTTGPPAGGTLWLTAILINEVAVPSSVWTQDLDVAGIDFSQRGSFTGQALVELEPGDQIQIGVAVDSEGDVVTTTVRSFSLIATAA